MEIKRHNNHMKKNQDEVEIFSVNEWTKKHLEKKCKEQIILTSSEFTESVIDNLALESRAAKQA